MQTKLKFEVPRKALRGLHVIMYIHVFTDAINHVAASEALEALQLPELEAKK